MAGNERISRGWFLTLMATLVAAALLATSAACDVGKRLAIATGH
jgi:hypothetical protein